MGEDPLDRLEDELEDFADRRREELEREELERADRIRGGQQCHEVLEEVVLPALQEAGERLSESDHVWEVSAMQPKDVLDPMLRATLKVTDVDGSPLGQVGRLEFRCEPGDRSLWVSIATSTPAVRRSESEPVESAPIDEVDAEWVKVRIVEFVQRVLSE